MKNIIKYCVCFCLVFIFLFSFCSCNKKPSEIKSPETYSEEISSESLLIDTPIISVSLSEMSNGYNVLVSCKKNNDMIWEYKKNNVSPDSLTSIYKILAQEDMEIYIWIDGEVIAIDASGNELWKTSALNVTPDCAVYDETNLYIFNEGTPPIVTVYNKETGKQEISQEINSIEYLKAPLHATINKNNIIIEDLHSNRYYINKETYEAISVLNKDILEFNFSASGTKEEIISDKLENNIIKQYTFNDYNIITMVANDEQSPFGENITFSDYKEMPDVKISEHIFKRVSRTISEKDTSYHSSFLKMQYNNLYYMIIVTTPEADYSDVDFKNIIKQITLL